jgi:hypothetical protein
MNMDELESWGFDQCRKDSTGDLITVRCSQCNAKCVNGTPIHEKGCPNEKHWCKGCNTVIPVRFKYCSDCG